MKKILVILGVLATTPTFAQEWITIPEGKTVHRFDRFADLSKLIDLGMSDDRDASILVMRDIIASGALDEVGPGKQLWLDKEARTSVGLIGCYRVRGEVDCKWAMHSSFMLSTSSVR